MRNMAEPDKTPADPTNAIQRDASAEPPSEQLQSTGPPYSIFTPTQKKIIVVVAAFGAVFSPMSTTIYLPALNTIAKDLNVSDSQINLTITTFLVCFRYFLRPNPTSQMNATERLIGSTGSARSCTRVSSWILGRGRKKTSLHDMLHNIHRSQHWPGHTKKLRCLARAPMYPERRQ